MTDKTDTEKRGWEGGKRSTGSVARDLDRKAGKADWAPSAREAFDKSAKDAPLAKSGTGQTETTTMGDPPHPEPKPGWAKGPAGPGGGGASQSWTAPSGPPPKDPSLKATFRRAGKKP